MQRSKSMQADTTEEEELNQQHRMKTMTDMKSGDQSKRQNGREHQLLGQCVAGCGLQKSVASP